MLSTSVAVAVAVSSISLGPGGGRLVLVHGRLEGEAHCVSLTGGLVLVAGVEEGLNSKAMGIRGGCPDGGRNRWACPSFVEDGFGVWGEVCGVGGVGAKEEYLFHQPFMGCLFIVVVVVASLVPFLGF